MTDAIRPLTAEEIGGPDFRHLLWLAVEVDDEQLDLILRDDVPRLQVHGVAEKGRVTAFVAFDAAVDPVTIEYIAVAESARGAGYGTALVHAVRRAANDQAVFAQTDDDAVDFYRRLGFDITPGEPDARWPERRRYDCVLASLHALERSSAAHSPCPASQSRSV